LPFQQQTILKIEKGSRPLKLEEASVIADILGIEMSSLTEQFNNDALAATVTEILQRAAAIAKQDKGMEELLEKRLRDDEAWRQVRSRWVQELREVERRLADEGAVKDGDGRWRWRNEDGSYSYLTVDV
jgi:hypothetical protein